METTSINEEDNSLKIAQTIISQIRYSDKVALMAWGASNFVALEESKEYSGGVRFHVNGLVFIGYVQIQLRWVDDYTITFLKRKGEVVKKCEGAYSEDLVPLIDWIECR